MEIFKKYVAKEVIIVLGQSLLPDGSIPSTLSERVRYAIDLYKCNPQLILIFSGADPAKTGVTEAEIMRKLVKEWGQVPDENIVMDERSENTIENCINSLEILGKEYKGTIHLVTSDFHIDRAVFIFKSVLCNYQK